MVPRWAGGGVSRAANLQRRPPLDGRVSARRHRQARPDSPRVRRRSGETTTAVGRANPTSPATLPPMVIGTPSKTPFPCSYSVRTLGATHRRPQNPSLRRIVRPPLSCLRRQDPLVFAVVARRSARSGVSHRSRTCVAASRSDARGLNRPRPVHRLEPVVVTPVRAVVAMRVPDCSVLVEVLVDQVCPHQ